MLSGIKLSFLLSLLNVNISPCCSFGDGKSQINSLIRSLTALFRRKSICDKVH